MGQSTRVFYQFANNTDMFKSRLDNFWKSHDIIYTTRYFEAQICGIGSVKFIGVANCGALGQCAPST